MAKSQRWFLTIDWMINWVGFILLFLCIGLIYGNAKKPYFIPWSENPLTAWNHIGSIGIPILYLLMTLSCTSALVIAQPKDKKRFQWRKYIVGFSIVWGFVMLSKWIAAQKEIHKANIGDSIWGIFFGCVFYQIVKRVNKNLLHCLNLAKQSELYISISLVLFVINYLTLEEIVGKSVFVAWIDTPILYAFFSYIGVKVFNLRPKVSIILTGCTVICGSSAVAALKKVLKAKNRDQKDVVTISSLLTIPCIVILPIIGKYMNISDRVAGAWFGGSIDSIGGVFATSRQFSQQAIQSGAVVKIIQNMLIAPISVLTVAFYIKYQDSIDNIEIDRTRTKSRFGSKWPLNINEEGRSISVFQQSKNQRGLSQKQNETNNLQTPFIEGSSSINDTNDTNDEENPLPFQSKKMKKRRNRKLRKQLSFVQEPKLVQPEYLSLIWERFPKFILGFIASIIIFNLSVATEKKEYGRDFIFCISEWFSSCSFICIGMGLELAKGDGRYLMGLTGIYILIQMFDILTTFGYSYFTFTYF